MFKTFSEFVELASRRFSLPPDIAEKMIDAKLKERGLGRGAVICYINWAGGDCLTQKKIGQNLGVTQQAVDKQLRGLKKVWPHLFVFGPKIPQFHHRRSCRGNTMGRLRANVPATAQKF